MADSLHIDLDVRVHGDEVEGRAIRAGEPVREFRGWVELLAALDALISGSEA
jgi:hypothetical protein